MKLSKVITICRLTVLCAGFAACGWLVSAYAEDVSPKISALDPALIEKFGSPDQTVVVPPVNVPSSPITSLDAPGDEDAEEAPTPVSNENQEINQQQAQAGEELIYLNATNVDIGDMVKQISKATGTNFLLDDKLKGKITIISEKPMTKDMAYQAFLSALQVLGYTTVMTPGGLLKIIQTKEAINQPVEIFRDGSPSTDRYITRIIQVKNISANELATVVKSLVSKDGNLFAYPTTNSLILTDAGSNIERILKIIKELDQEGPQEVIEIIPILNADASDITDKVLQLFEAATTKTSSNSRSRAPRGKTEPELEDSPSISKVIADERTNSVIVLGSKRSIIKVKELIARLDSPSGGVEGTIHVYYLKHANSKELADVLSNLVADAQSKTSTKGGGKEGAAEKKTGAVQLEGGVKVTADEGTNALVITASPKDFETLINMVVAKLDIPRRQVYLEAIVMELAVNKNNTFGVNGNLGNVFSAFGGNNLTAFGAVLPNALSTLSTIAGASGGVGGGIFSERQVSIPTPDGKSIQVPAVSAIIQALSTSSDVNVLSTPSILTLDNEEALIQVGEEVPVVNGQTTTTAGLSTSNVTREDTGIILKVTPQVSESNTVRLKIEQEISNALPVTSDTKDLGPTFTKRTVNTTVVASDKQTIVIGGLIDESNTISTGKVPLLGDVPVLGNLFKTKAQSKSKKNIIVFITAYIIRDRSDYLAILEKKINERNAFIDMNFGKSQRNQIRESIKNHANNLLEFKDVLNQNYGGSSAPTVIESSAPSSSSVSVSPATGNSAVSSNTSPAQAAPSQTTSSETKSAEKSTNK
ncbi:type II secretion system secretin GspD [bacterium]|nr:type II secretion system secretin GspD [bacterium]